MDNRICVVCKFYYSTAKNRGVCKVDGPRTSEYGRLGYWPEVMAEWSCGKWKIGEKWANLFEDNPVEANEQFVTGSKTPCATCQWLCWHSQQGCTCFWPKGNRHCE